MNRFQNIDLARGIVMIIMALDHVRDLIHIDSIAQSPTNLATTTPLLFFTRFITHFCAPTFVFLAGTSAFISKSKQNNISLTRSYLLTRGIWLVVLEFTIVNLGLFFDIGFHTLLLEVIAAIGFGFIVIGLCISIPVAILGIVGLVIIVAHNALPLIFDSGNVFSFLFSPTVIPLNGTHNLIMGYPLIPWLGIILIGYSLGNYFFESHEVQNKQFLKLGIICFIAFVVIRSINIYGDSAPWESQKNLMYTILSFLNITKYPPSLQFCLITLSALFLFLSQSHRLPSIISDKLLVYGRVPLFYFLAHFYIIHGVLIIILFAQDVNWSQMEFTTGTFGRPREIITGLSLGYVYCLWIVIVTGLYWPCRWYGKLKSSKRFKLLQYV